MAASCGAHSTDPLAWCPGLWTQRHCICISLGLPTWKSLWIFFFVTKELQYFKMYSKQRLINMFTSHNFKFSKPRTAMCGNSESAKTEPRAVAGPLSVGGWLSIQVLELRSLSSHLSSATSWLCEVKASHASFMPQFTHL